MSYLGSSVRGFKGTRISYSPSIQAVVELFHIYGKSTPRSFFKHPWCLPCAAYTWSKLLITPCARKHLNPHSSLHYHAPVTLDLLVCFALQVINKAFFKLSSDGPEQPEEPTAQKEDLVFLEVTLNKPFLLAVLEEKSRAMLFLGRVTNPLHGV